MGRGVWGKSGSARSEHEVWGVRGVVTCLHVRVPVDPRALEVVDLVHLAAGRRSEDRLHHDEVLGVPWRVAATVAGWEVEKVAAAAAEAWSAAAATLD